jgi:FtsH-binding integral membrane protein
MNPSQQDLLLRVVQLVSVMMLGGVASAWVFRQIFSWPLILISFLASIGLVFVTLSVSYTDNAPLIYFCSFLFGAAVAAVLGGFFMILGRKYDFSPEKTFQAVMVTMACAFITTILAGLIGIYSGLNFQGWGPYLFGGLFLLIGLSLAGLVGWISERTEYVIGIAAATFWAIYMVYDFNKVVDKYLENSWPAAVEIAMNLYLDIINFIIRIAPYIFAAMDD